MACFPPSLLVAVGEEGKVLGGVGDFVLSFGGGASNLVCSVVAR